MANGNSIDEDPPRRLTPARGAWWRIPPRRLPPRRLAGGAIAVALVAMIVIALVIGLSQAQRTAAPGGRRAFQLAVALESLHGSPAPLAGLHQQADRLLPGGPAALRARLVALRGTPVVINFWASWCYPCRQEMPLMQMAAISFGRRVAFLGLDSGDHVADARAFLHGLPLPYPSYQDPAEQLIQSLGGVGYPDTAFFSAGGRLRFLHQGAYASAGALAADIVRYALRP